MAQLLPDETPLDVTVQLGWDDVKNAVEGTDIYDLKHMIESRFNYTFAEGDPEGKFYFYIDQHDRTDMPWGFSGVVLEKNHETGFENVYHLIDPKEGGTYCAAHVDYAKHYLPTGKGFRETGSDYIDYSNGSCMMHSAMENYFQKYYPKPADSIKPDDILLTTLPPRPLTPDYDPAGGRAYGWCVPSIKGWQMIEKEERYLKTNSFVYQYGVGLDQVDGIENYPSYLKLPRSTALKYRLINIPPKFLKD